MGARDGCEGWVRVTGGRVGRIVGGRLDTGSVTVLQI